MAATNASFQSNFSNNSLDQANDSSEQDSEGPKDSAGNAVETWGKKARRQRLADEFLQHTDSLQAAFKQVLTECVRLRPAQPFQYVATRLREMGAEIERAQLAQALPVLNDVEATRLPPALAQLASAAGPDDDLDDSTDEEELMRESAVRVEDNGAATIAARRKKAGDLVGIVMTDEDITKVTKLQALQRGRMERRKLAMQRRLQKHDDRKVAKAVSTAASRRRAAGQVAAGEFSEQEQASIVKLQALQRGRLARRRVNNIRNGTDPKAAAGPRSGAGAALVAGSNGSQHTPVTRVIRKKRIIRRRRKKAPAEEGGDAPPASVPTMIE